MEKPIIQVEELSKSYQVAKGKARTDSLREALSNGAAAIGQRLRGLLTGQRQESSTQQEFWALRDVSFQVKRGEAVGVIGRNGAGKSTLLKVLSRITEPTAGRALLRGRVGSLLEVGTGFHTDLTGRENIYLNGSILGMGRREIQQKFDEIVSFAEVEQFLDTPVKRYSSGMYMRLAFSVAAHLQPEILIVDEVLAVGDLAFQKKCIGKMNDVTRQHRTILFVSHNMSVVRSLCTRGIVLDKGKVILDGSAHEAADAYTNASKVLSGIADAGLANRLDRTSGAVRFTSISLEDAAGRERTTFQCGETVRIRLSCKSHQEVSDLGLVLYIYSSRSRELITSVKTALSETKVPAGTEKMFTLVLPEVPLRPGEYSFYICLANKTGERVHDVIDDNVSLPQLCMTSNETDIHLVSGYFTVPSRLEMSNN
jgi:lipopolysaccharide transport system ATP-binding protein